MLAKSASPILTQALLGCVFLGSWGVTLGQPSPVKVGVPQPPAPPMVSAQSFTVFPDYGEGNAIAHALRNSPPKLYTFERASLRDVLRFLADDAGIPFISMQERAVPPPDGRPASLDDILVTFTMRASPFLVLESIAKANDIALVYDSGVWFMRPYNERELIGRIYRLKYTPQERITFNPTPATAAAAQQGADNNAASVPIFQVQQPQTIFQVEEPAIVKEIKNMLRISSDGVGGRVASQEASVGDFPPLPSTPGVNPAGSPFVSQPLAPPPAEPSVTFNSDTNTIYIIATRQQHQWVEGFLSAADRPQALIGIEVKFFETTKDPRKDMGINWAQTFTDGGWGISLDQELSGTGNVGFELRNSADRGFNNSRNFNEQRRGGRGSTSGTLPGDINGGAPFNFSYGRTDINDTLSNLTRDIYGSLRNYNAGLGAAYTAVLSPETLGFAIEAFMEDRDTSIVQYPRVLTVNNREVAISNARNEPLLVSDTTNNSSGSSTQTQGVSYLPVGTQLNILPKIMPDGSVVMNVAINVSNILRFKPLNVAGQVNEYPVTTSRVYQAALQVDSGYTLAVSGLEEAFDEKRDNGVLLLKDIPGLGQLFKSKGRAQNKRNLIIFITPTVIADRRSSGGISETPESVLPIRPDDPVPPAFGSDGRLVGGMGSLEAAFAWLARQRDLYEQINRENRISTKSLEQLESVIRTAQMVVAEIQTLAAATPGKAALLSQKEQTATQLLTDLNGVLERSRRNQFRPGGVSGLNFRG